MTRALADSKRVAISFSLSQSSISFAVKSIAIGLTLYWPAYFGAEPCVGSNTASVSPLFRSSARVYFCGRITLSVRRFCARFDHSEMIQHIREVLLQARHLAALAGDLDGELLK